MSQEPIRYRDDVEVEQPHEPQDIAETIDLMRHTLEQTFEVHRHGTSATHAKSHGVVTGALSVHDGLPPELAQGLFATPGSYEVVLRLASEPGQIDADTERRARGAALKVLDVPGEMLRAGWTSQDFLFNTWPIIPQGTVSVYLDAIRQRDRHFGHTQAVRVGTALRHPAPKGLLFDRTPNISPVAHSYYTQGAFRYGEHVAKLSLAPATQEQLALVGEEVDRHDPPGVLRDLTRSFFAEHEARFDLRVQLCTDLAAMPVEDASVEWPEEQSPYRTVGTVVLPSQDSFATPLRVFAEDVMSWRPWYSLAAHRPLGSINRVRREAYETLGAWRHRSNATPEVEPRRLSDLPS